MAKKICLLFLSVFCLCSIANADNSNLLAQPVLFDSGMEQHGSFSAEDLRTSPLLRSMFNLSVNDVNGELVRVCINPQNECRVMRRDAKVYLVSNNGRVKFDDVN